MLQYFVPHPGFFLCTPFIPILLQNSHWMTFVAFRGQSYEYRMHIGHSTTSVLTAPFILKDYVLNIVWITWEIKTKWLRSVLHVSVQTPFVRLWFKVCQSAYVQQEVSLGLVVFVCVFGRFIYYLNGKTAVGEFRLSMLFTNLCAHINELYMKLKRFRKKLSGVMFCTITAPETKLQ
jgi:hypothetical protein